MSVSGVKKPKSPLERTEKPHGFMIEPPKVVGLGALIDIMTDYIDERPN